MIGFTTLLKRSLVDSRWTIAMVGVCLFGLAWLFVLAASRVEARRDPGSSVRRVAFVRMVGGPSADDSSTSLEMVLWRHPFVIALIGLLPIARGSMTVAGYLERGWLDSILSRPMARSTFLNAQVGATLIGLAILAVALVAGNQVGNRMYVVEKPPSALTILKPAVLAMSLGLAIYGYTFLLSSLEIARWRATLFGSAITFASYLLHLIPNFPGLEDWEWLEKYSFFQLYDPVEAAVVGKSLLFNALVLGGIGAVGIALGYLAFLRRDLASSGG